MTPTIGEIDGLPALVVLEGGWRDEYANVIEAHGLAVLSIMVRGDDLSFLRGLAELRGLVLDAGEVRDLSPVVGLPLETRTLNTPSKPRIALDFTAFPALRTLRIYWNPGFESVFAWRALDSLFIFVPPDADLFPEALSELVDLPPLRVIAIESCTQISSLDAVAGLPLQRLKLADCGEIASLAPLRGLNELEEFFAWESTRVADGDLSVVLELPRLRAIGMQDRREYRPRVREIEAVL